MFSAVLGVVSNGLKMPLVIISNNFKKKKKKNPINRVNLVRIQEKII